MSHSHRMSQVAEQVRQARAGGAQKFWQEMKPQLERMVRRVVRWGPSSSPLEQKIGLELDRVGPVRGESSSDLDNLIGTVARRLCQEMYDRMETPVARPWQDTQRPVAERDLPTVVETPRVLLSA